MDYTRVQHVGISNCLKVSYSLDYPDNTPHSYKKYKMKRSGNSTLNSMSDVDPFVFDCSADYKSPPKADLHSQTDKQETTNMYLIYELVG